MYIQGCAEKLVKAGKCVLGIKVLLNQCVIKMVKGNNFGDVNHLIRITPELMKDMQFSR